MAISVVAELEAQVVLMEKQAGMPSELVPASSDRMLHLKKRQEKVLAVRKEMIQLEEHFLGLYYRIHLMYSQRENVVCPEWINLYEVYRKVDRDIYSVRIQMLRSILSTAKALASNRGMPDSEMTEWKLSLYFREWTARVGMGQTRH